MKSPTFSARPSRPSPACGRGRDPAHSAGSNCVLAWLGMFPRLVIADHGVEGDEHFAHESNRGDLRRFSGGDEALVEVAEWGLAAGGGTGGHVESGSNRGAPAGDGSGSGEFAAVVIEGGKADERGDGAARDPAEFGQQGDEGNCRDVLDALQGLEQPDLGNEARDLADRLEDEGVGFVDLALDQRQALAVLGLEEDAVERAGLIADGDALIDQTAPVGHQFGQALAGRIENVGRGVCGLGIARDDTRIDPVVLGVATEALGIEPNAQRIEPPYVEARLEQGPPQALLIAAGRLESDHDARFDAERLQQADHRGPAGAVIAGALEPLQRRKPEIEPFLRYVDADKSAVECHNPCVPALHVRARAQATVRVNDGTAADLAPRRWFAATRRASEGDRSDGRRAGGACPTSSTLLLPHPRHTRVRGPRVQVLPSAGSLGCKGNRCRPPAIGLAPDATAAARHGIALRATRYFAISSCAMPWTRPSPWPLRARPIAGG